MSTPSESMDPTSPALILPFHLVNAADLPRVGGKGANLGEMTRMGFAVPPGFCVTTEAFQRFMAGAGPRDALHSELDALALGDIDAARSAGQRVRDRLLEAPVPADVERALLSAFRKAGADHAYAVRSSATAEDLPDASFAGQQDTFLNVRGEAALLSAVRACWASLFTERAILYRAQHGFSHREVSLAVVVQRMIFPDVSGILFTADPVTGHRGILSIDAGYGLGEALVSGLVSADLYRVNKKSRQVIERRIADKRMAIRPAPGGGTLREELSPEQQRAEVLTDPQIAELTDLGIRIEAHYGRPMDIEWGIEQGRLHALQARPVTSLFPLPEPRPTDGLLHVYMSFGHAQVMTDPMSPMTLTLWRMIFPFGKPRGSSEPNPRMIPAAGRLYVDVSPLLRQPLGRRLFQLLVPKADRLIAAGIAEILARGDLDGAAPGALASTAATLRWVGPMLLKIQARLWGGAPEGTTDALSDFVDRYAEKIHEQLGAARPGADRLRAARALLGRIFLEAAGHIMPYVASGVMAHALLERLLDDPEATNDLLAITRGLSGNVTTEMDLALGDLADKARGCDALAARLIAGADVESALQVARAAPGGEAFLAAWQAFIARYGMRGPSEIDIARPRFRDEPKALLELISANLQHGEAGAHRAHYQRLAAEGEAAAARLVARARTGPLGRARARLASRLVRVARASLPAREHPKFLLMRFFDGMRSAILEAAGLLLEQGRLDALSDIWALELDEVIHALEHPAEDVLSRVRLRQTQMARFRQMRPPRVITSDGEIPVVRHASAHLPEGALPGAGVSAGVIEGVARVVLDPQKERLRPGEILVAPFTDPGWTPLFIHAAGLVTEVGGMMTHGSVVAREYGIPAVVGVLDATRSIQSGQRIRVDGDRGYVTILQAEQAPPIERVPS